MNPRFPEERRSLPFWLDALMWEPYDPSPFYCMPDPLSFDQRKGLKELAAKFLEGKDWDEEVLFSNADSRYSDIPAELLEPYTKEEAARSFNISTTFRQQNCGTMDSTEETK